MKHIYSSWRGAVLSGCCCQRKPKIRPVQNKVRVPGLGNPKADENRMFEIVCDNYNYLIKS